MKWGLKFLPERVSEGGREIMKNRGRKGGRMVGQEWVIWQAIKGRESREDQREGETEKFGLLLHLFLFCPLVPFTPLPLFFLSSPCFFSSPHPAHYKNSMIMLQTWAAEQITFREGECGDGTSREAGKDSHWVTKRERMREIARGMKAYWSSERNYCKARKKKKKTTRRKKKREGKEV